jgi:hypothetical protein
MPKFDLHVACLELARDRIGAHTNHDLDGNLYFNLPTFLDDVESTLIVVLEGNNSPTNGFALDPTALARYLYCCLALENGDVPVGQMFHGLPVAD